MIVANLVLIQLSYQHHYQNLRNFGETLQIKQKKKQKDNLITNLLPSHMLTKFYSSNKMKLELSDYIEQATLLYADIAGFTAYSASVAPEVVVEMLRALMTEFDKESVINNVYKVYTIGGIFIFNRLLRRSRSQRCE